MTDFTASLDWWGLLEFAAMVTGLVYVILEIKKTRRMWHWMIISSICNGFVFAHKGFLSMTLIQFYYIITAIYGIITWTKVVKTAQAKYGPVHHKEVAIVPFNRRKALYTIALALVVFCVLAALSARVYVPATGDVPGKPYWDSAVAVLSMLATYWLSQSWYAQWYVWVAVNLAAIVMFLYPVFTGHPEVALPLMGVLYVLYMISTVVGMINWKKNGVIIENIEGKQ